LAATTYAATALGIVTGPIAARALGPTGRGEYAAVVSYATFTTAILALGMTFSITHALLTDKTDPGRVLGVVLRFCAWLVLPSLGVAAVVALVVLHDYSTAGRIGAFVFVAIVPVSVFQQCGNAFLLAEGALGTVNVVRLAPLLLGAVGTVALALLGELTLASYLVLTVAGSLVTLALLIRRLGVRPSRGGSMGPQLRFGARGYPGSLAYFTNLSLDQVLIAPVLGPTDLGYYAIAVAVSNLPLGLAQALSARSISSVAHPDGGLDHEKAGKMVRRGTALGAVCTAAVALIAPVLVPLLYGAAFDRVVGLCLVLMIGTVALAIGTMAGPMLTIAGRPGANSIAELTSVVVTIAGLAALIPPIGVMGAAVTSAAAYWVRALMQLRTLRQLGTARLTPGFADVLDIGQLVAARLPARLRRA
jgi:O-antigen/teichoic acid export membrane protein